MQKENDIDKIAICLTVCMVKKSFKMLLKRKFTDKIFADDEKCDKIFMIQMM